MQPINPFKSSYLHANARHRTAPPIYPSRLLARRPTMSSSSSSSLAAPHGTMSTDTTREESSGCLPADQSCFALSASSPYPSRRAVAAARACCTTTSYLVVLGISFGSLLAILFILCIIRWYLVWRSERWEEGAAATDDAALGLAKKRSAGLDADTIAALPEFVYRKEDYGGGGGEEEEGECAVCLAEMADEDAARRLPRCMHVFHRGCVDVWLREHSTCPVCRAEVIVRPTAGERTAKEHEGSTSRALTSPARPQQRMDDGERDLEAQ